MRLKTITVGALLAALVAVAPAAALASPELQTSGGTKIAIGTTVTGKSTGVVVYTTATGIGKCGFGHLTGTVQTNSGSLVQVKIESFKVEAGGCPAFTFENLPWCMSSSALGEWVLKGGGCEKENVPLAYSAGFCKYQLSTMANSYQQETSPLTMATIGNDQTWTRVSGLCGASAVFHWLFKLTTTAGGELKIV
jgi:hypothetical protein